MEKWEFLSPVANLCNQRKGRARIYKNVEAFARQKPGGEGRKQENPKSESEPEVHVDRELLAFVRNDAYLLTVLTDF